MVARKPRVAKLKTSSTKKSASRKQGLQGTKNASQRKMSTHTKPLKELLKSVAKKWEMKKFVVRKGATGDIYVLKKIFAQNKYLSLWRKHSPSGKAVLEGKRILDVGANIGAFTVRALAEQATVVAVEADPENFTLLQKNAPSATAVHGAVVPRRQPRSVHMFSKPKMGQPNRNSLIHDHINTVELGITVPALQLASIFTKYGPFDFVKIDIEGTEVALFEQLQLELAQSGKNLFIGTELLIYFHVDKFPEVRIFHQFILQLREMFSIVELEPVVGKKKMIDNNWEKRVVRNPGLRFRKLPGVAAAKQDILLYCGHASA